MLASDIWSVARTLCYLALPRGDNAVVDGVAPSHMPFTDEDVREILEVRGGVQEGRH